MARYAITISAIAAIIFAAADSAGAATPQEPKELTVLAYNTHFFEDSSVDCLCRCSEFFGKGCHWADYVFEDHTRRAEMASWIADSGADIVALQEVWATPWQEWFVNDEGLKAIYPHAEIEASQSKCLVDVDDGCFPWCGDKEWTLGSGLVLLSKWPLSDIGFERFPTFEQCSIGGCETWSDKGVLTAVVNVGEVTIRVGISHGLTRPHDEKSKWDTDYVSTGVTTFQLNGDAYIFALKKDNKGRIVRMEDYGRWWDEKEPKYNSGAGWKPVWDAPPFLDFDIVTSFGLDGHPYLFAGSNTARRAYIFRINDDPSSGWTQMYVGAWDVNTPHPGYDGLAAWYRFQNNNLDSSGNGHDGTPYASPTYSSDCKEDTRSINLDGENDYVEVNYYVGISGASPRTIAGWVKATKPAGEIPGWAGVFGFTSTGGADTHFDIQRNGRSDNYCIHVYGWEQNIIPLDQEWHHLAATYDGTTIAWYSDGHQVGSEDRSLDTNDHVQIGKRADREWYFPGLVDDVRIYSRALSQGEIGYLAGLGYITVESFELDGHPYLFGLKTGNEADIFRINDDPCMGWENIYSGIMGSDYVAVTSFELDGHPYLFGIHETAGAYIRRINDDPCTGWQTIHGRPMSSDYVHVTSFELDGHPYVFALRNETPTRARILRINDDPCTGWTEKFVGYCDPNDFTYLAVQSFEMNGHPYLFALRNCCDKEMDSTGCRRRPGEAYLKRINDDPTTGWEDLLQLEDIRIIRDETVVDEDEPPAIMMGDLNIHAHKYGIMDRLFGKAGAVDAYIEVHGIDTGGDTVDLRNNKFAQKLCKDNPDTPGDECNPDDPRVYTRGRIDYVYVKQSGAGLRLVPTEADVFRDWKYYSDGAQELMDLSDHYPVFVKFKLFEGGCTARAKGDLNCDRLINFADLAILSSAWMSGPNDISWDGACDISDPPDDFIDTKDVDIIARSWLTMPPIHNVTQNTCYKFIQTAIDDAKDGDEIEVAPGTYYEAINFKRKALRLYSTAGPNDTIIDANGAFHVVQCVSGEDANTIIEGFTITGGNATGGWPDYYGGGMYNQQSSPTVTNCIFTGNSASSGGGMYNNNSSPTVTNCIFSGNSPTGRGGGMYNYYSSPAVTDCTFNANQATGNGGGMYNDGSSPTVTNCTFSENKAIVYYGGGMYNKLSSPTVTDCNFTNNSASRDGGGVYNNSNSGPTVTNCTFSNNSATTAGGGMWNGDGSDPNVTNCNFTGNTADTDGGGMHNNDSSPTVTNCNFNGNDATRNGGGMYNNWCSPRVRDCTFAGNTASDGGGIYNGSVSSPAVTNCIFSGNEATSDGGGIYVYGGEPHLTNCIFSGNSATNGGGIYRWNPAYLTNCTFHENTASYGGGMYNYQNYACLLTNCTFSGNGASVDGGGMYNDNSSPTVTNCILWGDTPDEIYNYSASPVVTYSDIQGGWGGAGNIDAAPCFVDANNPDPNVWNLRLSYDSNCIDAGNNKAVPSAVTTDLDGNPRFVDDPETDDTGSGTPPIVDMGAYEYFVPPPPQSSEVGFKYLAIICAEWLAGTKPEL